VIERFTVRSGVRIRYLDNAPPEPVGLPILMVPGFTDFAEEYVELLDAAAPRRLLVVEVRGRGQSAAPPTGYRAADHVADLAAVLDEEGIGRFHLMTFSRGTTWGLDLALADPHRVATVAVGDYWAGEKHLPVERAEQVLESRFRGLPMAERIPSHVVRQLFADSVERDLLGAVAATGLPVLLATGTEPGCLLDAAAIDEWRSEVPGVEVTVIDGAAHDLFRPDRLAYLRAVIAFIAARSPGA
jgi:pimeloyl-ACP methyl ester carboxylesterase